MGIRPYRPEDRADVYDVCVRTAAGGSDARGRFPSDDLPGDIWAGPYLALEPELAFVLDAGDGAEEADRRVIGYVLGSSDTRRFVERWRLEWLPGFSARYPEDDDTRDGYHPERMLIPEVDEYPAHLHVDLLPEAQGGGWGRALVRQFLSELAKRGVPGAHLGVDPANVRALGFYRRLGFRELPSATPDSPLLGIDTGAKL